MPGKVALPHYKWKRVLNMMRLAFVMYVFFFFYCVSRQTIRRKGAWTRGVEGKCVKVAPLYDGGGAAQAEKVNQRGSAASFCYAKRHSLETVQMV